MTAEQLPSGIAAAFDKRLNEALQINPATPFLLENGVKPSLVTGVLKGSQGTPGLVAAISAIKDELGTIRLATTSVGDLRGKELIYNTVTAAGATVALYTVPAGKVFFILELAATMRATGNHIGVVHVGADTDARLLTISSVALAVYHPTDHGYVHIVYPKPLAFPAGTVINALSDNANLSLYPSIVGYLEDANV